VIAPLVWLAAAAAAEPTSAPVAASATATATGTAGPVREDATFPGVVFDVSAEFERNDSGAPDGAFASFWRTNEGRIDLYRLDLAAREATPELLASWLDEVRPGDSLEGGLHAVGGVLRGYSHDGKGLVLAVSAPGAYVAIVSPGRMLDLAIPAVTVTAAPPPSPAFVATKAGVAVRVPPGFVALGPADAPPWAEVALGMPLLGPSPPALWLHAAARAEGALDTPAGRAAALIVLRAELGAAGLGAANDAAPGDGAATVETIGGRPVLMLRAPTPSFDLAAAYLLAGEGDGAPALVATLRVRKDALPRYEGALRGVVASAVKGATAGAAATGTGATAGAAAATPAPEPGGAHGGAPPMSNQRAIVALVLFLGLSLGAYLAWRQIRTRMAGAGGSGGGRVGGAGGAGDAGDAGGAGGGGKR
jgi:hypothetical protein